MDRHSRKRITSRITNLVWRLGVTLLLVLFALYAYGHWFLPWFGAVDDAI